ncbi:MAG: hypothetical protein CG439_2707 [Methylococcaceae bacterium NSP1-2]|nr:MAG: hypothetical protein CG439_2707 [Methylococcaceae bacterium NSP1-2]
MDRGKQRRKACSLQRSIFVPAAFDRLSWLSQCYCSFVQLRLYRITTLDFSLAGWIIFWGIT